MARPETMIIRGYQCANTISFTPPLRTPGGSRITVVRLCLDVEFAVEANRIAVYRVALSQIPGEGLDGCNMSSPRTGEAWHGNWIGPEAPLAQLLRLELLIDNAIGGMMLQLWRETHPGTPFMRKPFNVRMLNLSEEGHIGHCDGCGEYLVLSQIATGQLLCSNCLAEIRGGRV